MPLAPGETITSTSREYEIVKSLATGEFSDVYLADIAGEISQAVLKVDRHDGDCSVDEAFRLAQLYRDGDEKLQPFLPRLIDHFLDDNAGDVNAYEYLDGWYTLNEVRDVYPDGVHARDMAWMFRRVLAAAGFVGRLGVTHGAIIPEHVMIHPEQHGLKLIGWPHAVSQDPYEDFERPAAGYIDWYPKDLKGGVANAHISLDVKMAVKCGIYLLGGDPIIATLPEGAPREFRAFFSTAVEHADPWTVLKYFDDLLERIWGKRRFHPFTMTP